MPIKSIEMAHYMKERVACTNRIIAFRNALNETLYGVVRYSNVRLSTMLSAYMTYWLG